MCLVDCSRMQGLGSGPSRLRHINPGPTPPSVRRPGVSAWDCGVWHLSSPPPQSPPLGTLNNTSLAPGH